MEGSGNPARSRCARIARHIAASAASGCAGDRSRGRLFGARDRHCARQGLPRGIVRPARAPYRNGRGGRARGIADAVGRSAMTRNRWPLIAAALLAGCAAPPVSREVTTAEATLYTFVVLAAEGAPIARAITSAAACPDIELDGDARAMSVRAPPGTMPLRPTLSTPANSKPSAFPVLTCESSIPPGTTRATIAGRALPLPKAVAQRLVVIGDTGCRIKTADKVFQACNDPARWPFAAVANAAA